MKDEIKKSWNDHSDEYYNRIYKVQDDTTILKSDPMWAFPIPICTILQDNFSDFHGLRVLVPSSGDNGAVFAFHLLGAKVTSSDISERQLENAKRIADGEGWDIEFICADSMKLDGIADGFYDLVYTSNGVHTWIDDLNSMYSNFNRVLKQGGRYIMFETHPFIRPFDDSGDEIKIIKDYNNTEGLHWRVMDLFNSMTGQGFMVVRMDEFHAEIDAHDLWWYKTRGEAEADGNRKFDFKNNLWAALPQWIGFSAVKI
ncbi:MAG: class I SAM-dependent methyltransferase [Eubacteriales bacterium]|nr:class I SAM-dependent methyltransferase [Eubacteriales bacterium]